MIIKIKNWLVEYRLKRCFIVRNDLNKNYLTVPIEITRGKYKGLIYRYGMVTIQSELSVKYEYAAISNGHMVDDSFVNFGGRILTYLLTKKNYYDIITQQDREEED